MPNQLQAVFFFFFFFFFFFCLVKDTVNSNYGRRNLTVNRSNLKRKFTGSS